jgi:hypothetical protein
MMNTPFFKKLAVATVAVFFASCDKDYNTIGSDIVCNENFNFTHEEYEVRAYNQKVPPIQTNNLPINQLGILKNDVFGKTKANFVTQLSLAQVKPKFTSGIEIDSVILTVPYFSHKTGKKLYDHDIYKLDSINSSNENSTSDNPIYDPINLKIFRNNFYLNDYDPSTNLATSQRFYSNQDSDFSSSSSNPQLNNMVDVAGDDFLNENDAFIPDVREIVIKKRDANFVETEDVDTRIKPSMRLHLDKVYFRDNILIPASTPATAGNFDNNNIFRNYFRGLYFQVEDVPASLGTLMSMDFSKGNVTIYYRQDKVLNTPAVKEMKSMVLNMTGNSVNLLDNTDEADYNTAVTDANGYMNGAETLYVKGGQGSKAYVELFTNVAQFNELKDKKALINDASLTFTVKNIPGLTNKNPQRIYIFNADKNTPLYDYYFDSSSQTNSKLNKYIHGGIIDVNEDNGVTTYRVRITQHVEKILNGTQENVRLGVVVTENINMSSYGFLRNSVIAPSLLPDVPTGAAKVFDRLPIASVMNPLGVVFYGTTASVPVDKKVKFEIYYTKPN